MQVKFFVNETGGESIVIANNGYYGSKTTGGTELRLLGINNGNEVYMGSIDAGANNVYYKVSRSRCNKYRQFTKLNFCRKQCHVKGSSAGNTQIRITDSTGTTGTNSFDLINDGTAAYVWNRKQTDLNFATYGTLRMKIRASGTVGIGANGGFDSQMLSIDAGVLDGAIYATSTDANCFASFRDGNKYC